MSIQNKIKFMKICIYKSFCLTCKWNLWLLLISATRIIIFSLWCRIICQQNELYANSFTFILTMPWACFWTLSISYLERLYLDFIRLWRLAWTCIHSAIFHYQPQTLHINTTCGLILARPVPNKFPRCQPTVHVLKWMYYLWSFVPSDYISKWPKNEFWYS